METDDSVNHLGNEPGVDTGQNGTSTKPQNVILTRQSIGNSLYYVNRGPAALIHHQGVICCVAIDRFSLRRITYTPQSALLGAWHLTPCWCPGLLQNPLPLLIKWKFDGGFWSRLMGRNLDQK
jgi:hypothetical protein